jgi:hypothetical protein
MAKFLPASAGLRVDSLLVLQTVYAIARPPAMTRAAAVVID